MLRQQMRSVSRAEEAWRTEAAWRSAMEDSLAVGIRARDMDGRLIYVNKTLADMVGYRPDELEGLLPPMPYWVPDDLEDSMKRHRRNMAGQAPREGYESRWQHRDGSAVDVMVFEAPLVDAKGHQIGWMASILNITERKRLEERERKQMETMAHHARLTMIGEVASTLAHELNQPLSAIASYNAGVLNSLKASQAPEPRVLQALERMGEQAAHAGRIVRRIREFLTRHEPQLEPCAMPEVVHSAVQLLRRDIARHQVQVDLQGRGADQAANENAHSTGFLQMRHDETGNKALLTVVDPDRLRRVLLEVLSEDSMLSPHGLRSVSKRLEGAPYQINLDGQEYGIDYEPAESTTPIYGGNSNWRGPVWFPINHLVIEALERYYLYLGDDFTVECPTGSGVMMNLQEVAAFTLVASFFFHAYWSVPADAAMMQQLLFWKNIAVTGGLLGFAAHGAGGWSVDARRH